MTEMSEEGTVVPAMPPAHPAPAETYVPTDGEAEQLGAFLERQASRPAVPKVKVLTNEAGEAEVAPDHPEPVVWSVLMANALGVDDFSLSDHLAEQITDAAHRRGSRPRQTMLNGALAAAHGIGPTDTIEAMLAVQMVATHEAALDLLRQARGASRIPQAQSAGNTAVKLLRTFTAQVEALKRYRSKGEQRVVVQHQHVNVNADRAAVQVNAGSIPGGGGVGVIEKTEEQAHASAIAVKHCSPLLRQDPARDALPVARGEG